MKTSDRVVSERESDMAANLSACPEGGNTAPGTDASAGGLASDHGASHPPARPHEAAAGRRRSPPDVARPARGASISPRPPAARVGDAPRLHAGDDPAAAAARLR